MDFEVARLLKVIFHFPMLMVEHEAMNMSVSEMLYIIKTVTLFGLV